MITYFDTSVASDIQQKANLEFCGTFPPDQEQEIRATLFVEMKESLPMLTLPRIFSLESAKHTAHLEWWERKLNFQPYQPDLTFRG